jgi:hypothetical protein
VAKFVDAASPTHRKSLDADVFEVFGFSSTLESLWFYVST